ncbi:MAG: rhomboid family intramembrane serine protease [Opitutaceae bacterium]|nr:rhomboid family intramembrane serine protease [Opitutaceae bacterium]
MASTDLAAEPVSGRGPENLVEVGVYTSSDEGFDHGLVVLAMGQPYCLAPSGSSFQLLVEPPVAEAVRDQLACFDRESADWPPSPVGEPRPVRRMEFTASLLWLLSILAAYWAQGAWPACEDAGVLDAQAVFDCGQWWRLGTALFLHADAGHLTANGVSGLLVFAAVLSTIGRWRGGLLLAFAALTANLVVAAVHYPGPYRSLGASTAVFAGLGLLTGRAVRSVHRMGPRQRWRTIFVPLASGVILLALYGAGGLRVDVLAHATGFTAGLILGLAAAGPPRKTGHKPDAPRPGPRPAPSRQSPPREGFAPPFLARQRCPARACCRHVFQIIAHVARRLPALGATARAGAGACGHRLAA